MWSKRLLCRFRQSGKIPQVQVSRGFAAFRLAPSRIAPRHSQIKRDTNFATPGYSLSCHDTTARGKNKVFSVCGHLCGQSRFCAAFGNRGKSSKRRCCKALRRFTMPRPGYRHGTPKCRALPVEPHPDIHFSAMIPRRGVKIKIFLSVVIPVVKADFIPLSATGGKPAIARAARLCGLLSKPRMDRVYALPKQARYQLRYTRLFSLFIRLVVFSQMWHGTNSAIPG